MALMDTGCLHAPGTVTIRTMVDSINIACDKKKSINARKPTTYEITGTSTLYGHETVPILREFPQLLELHVSCRVKTSAPNHADSGDEVPDGQ
jgi:hypothetical protein